MIHQLGDGKVVENESLIKKFLFIYFFSISETIREKKIEEPPSSKWERFSRKFLGSV